MTGRLPSNDYRITVTDEKETPLTHPTVFRGGSRTTSLLPPPVRALLLSAFLGLLLSGGVTAQPAGGGWTAFGPGGGNASAVAIDPVDPANVYAAVEGSIYQSTDGGVTWTARLGPSYSLVTVDPSNPSIVYAAGTQVARSRDGGRTWRTVLADSPFLVYGPAALTVSSTGTVFVGTDVRVLRSVDSGRSWAVVLSDPEATGFLSILVDPAQPSRVSAAAGVTLWQSTDGGAAWVKSSDLSGLLSYGFGRLAQAPSAPARFYASKQYSSGILRSDDGGTTWSQVGLVPGFAGSALVVDPGSASRVYAAGDDGVFVSADGGETWGALQAGLPTPSGHPLRVRALALAPSRPAVFYAGADGWGVARSTSAGARWQIGVETGLNASRIEALTFAPLRPGTVYVSQDGGRRTFRTTDGGLSWQPFARDIALFRLYGLAFDPVDPDVLYAAGERGTARSVDGGATWAPFGGPPASSLALLGRQTLLAGECGLSRSPDGGTTWAQVIPCFADQDQRILLALWVDPKDSRTAYAHFRRTGGFHDDFFEVLRSRDGGATWKSLPLSRQAIAFAVAPGNPSILYAVDGTSQAARLLSSGDGGTSWKVADAHLPADAFILSGALAVDAVNPRKLYLGARDGLLISHDGGRTLELNGAPPEIGKQSVLQVWTDRAHPGLVYAGAGYGGLYVRRFE